MGFFTFENFASRATDAMRRDKAWDRAGKLRLVMRNRTILVAVLISPYFYQKVDGSGVRVSAGSTLRVFAPSSQNVLWDGFLTPEGSEGVPNGLRILHDMIALLQENKIRKREVSISTYTS